MIGVKILILRKKCLATFHEFYNGVAGDQFAAGAGARPLCLMLGVAFEACIKKIVVVSLECKTQTTKIMSNTKRTMFSGLSGMLGEKNIL